ncbi:MAG: MFS transporter, partial [Methanothrix sp.]|nr:MFS transporter [Methanothrix sp.]
MRTTGEVPLAREFKWGVIPKLISMDVCQDERTRGCVLVVAMLASFLPPFMASSINIALPAIGDEFSIDAVLLGWIATSYLLSSAVLMVPFGKYADIYGMKRIFILGLAVFTISSLLAAEAPSSLFLIASRVVQGIGAAMIFGTSTAILVRAYPIAERGRVLGINAASVYLGLSLGPFLGGLLTQYLGWRSLFLVSVPLGLVPLALAAFMLRDELAGEGEDELDLLGSLIYSIMLISVMYGFSRLPSALGAALVLGGFIVLLLLIRWESRVKSPVLDISLFRGNRVYAFSNLAALINYSATFSVTFLLSLYLQYIKGLQPDEAGLILVAQPLVMTLLSPYTCLLYTS